MGRGKNMSEGRGKERIRNIVYTMCVCEERETESCVYTCISCPVASASPASCVWSAGGKDTWAC